MTVAQLLDQISSAELAEWRAFSNIEPFGEERADLRTALNTCTMANAWRGKGQRAFKLKDFLLNFEPPKVMSWQSMKEFMKKMARK